MIVILVEGITNTAGLIGWVIGIFGVLGTVISTVSLKLYNTLKEEMAKKELVIKEKEDQLYKYRSTIREFSNNVNLIKDNENLRRALSEYKDKEKAFYEMYIVKFEGLATFIANLESIGVKS